MPMRTPYFKVVIEGKDVTPWVASVSAVEDDQQADNVSLTIPDPRMIYADALLEGSTVDVFMGYADPGENAQILRAIITKVEVSYPESGVPALTLKGEDHSIMMGIEEKNKNWDGTGGVSTVGALVKKIAGNQTFNGKSLFSKAEVQLSPDPPLTKKTPVHQNGKTDLAFLQDRAKTYHAKCFVELDESGSEVLYFIPERRILNRPNAERIILRYRMGTGSNLVSFSPTFDSGYMDRLKEKKDVDGNGKKVESQPKPPVPIVVWTLDPDIKALANSADRERIETIYGKGSAAKVKLQEQFLKPKKAVGEVVVDKTRLEAENDVLASRQLGMSASGSTFGNIWLRAKSNVEIQGVNARFRGTWYVSSVTQKIDGSGFKTDFKCVR
jgi:phage protein D